MTLNDVPTVPLTTALAVTNRVRYLSRWQWTWIRFEMLAFHALRLARLRSPFTMDLSEALGLRQKKEPLPEPKETRQVCLQFDSQETDRVVRRARVDGTTVHGASTAAALIALLPFGQERQHGKDCHENDVPLLPQTIECGHLVSLWNKTWYRIPVGSMTGCYITLFSMTCAH